MHPVHAGARLSTGRAPGARRPRWLACIIAFRIVAVLLSLEFSGVAHAALDGYEASKGVEQHAEDDCGDEAGHECAPGCPNCHCWHAGLPSAPVAASSAAEPLVSPRAEAGFVPYTTMPLRGADPDAVYRPPRLISAHL